MCGIVGIYSKKADNSNLDRLENAVRQLNKRGPDHQNAKTFNNRIGLAHARLSIIDTSDAAHQPFYSDDKRYVLTFNGEIYNYLEIRKRLEKKGFQFHTSSDTEVLLKAFIAYGKDCLDLFNGFFAFAVLDTETNDLFIARDRMGIKPLHIYEDDDQIIWASELKAIFAFNIDKTINTNALGAYFKFNYLPSDLSILQQVRKLLPGHCGWIQSGELTTSAYYELKYDSNNYSQLSYAEAQKELDQQLRKSIEKRLVADVPLGSFLSGGIDSSVISGIASEMKPGINTFSIGYADEPLFDETRYAELVANKFKTNHHVFKLKNDDLLESFYSFEQYIDEPFADSSALAVNRLSKETKKLATVALSGDGADELFSGYNKHKAEYWARQNGMTQKFLSLAPNVWKFLPQSRNSKLGNLFRQLDKLTSGLKLSDKQRYWEWASISKDQELNRLLKSPINNTELFKTVTEPIGRTKDFNDFLWADLLTVLPGDMLTKVDLMSMNNSLEVRVPFLDHNLIEFVNQLPAHYKIDNQSRKKILQDTYRSFLPEELYHRPKHGFEVPLLKWFNNELKNHIDELILNHSFISEQNIFNFDALENLIAKLRSNNPGDSTAKVWAIIVFQVWWKKYYVLND